MVPRCGEHALDLVVFPLGEDDFDFVFADEAGAFGGQRLGFVGEFYAAGQLGDEGGGGGVCGGGDVGFVDVALGGALGVDEGAVIGEEEQAGGVVVEAADGLQAAFGEGVGEEGEYAGVVAGFAAAFDAGGFVQRQVEAGVVGPGNAVDGEGEAFGGEVFLPVGGGVAVDGDLAAGDQGLALPAGAEALALEDAV